MKSIGSVKEDLTIEKRISITPETVKKYTNSGFKVNLEKKGDEKTAVRFSVTRNGKISGINFLPKSLVIVN